MEKNIKITRPSGEDNYKVLSAFESNGSVYVVIDSKLKDANQNTITFVCKENNDTLEYVDGNDWDQVKKVLIDIVKGNNDIVFKEVKEAYQASENIGHTIALKDTHVNALVDSYQLPEKIEENNDVTQEVQQELNTVDDLVTEQPVVVENVVEESQPSVLESAIGAATNITDENVDLQQPVISEDIPVVDTPVMDLQPEINLDNNIVQDEIMEAPVIQGPILEEPIVTPIDDIVSEEPIDVPIIEENVIEEPVPIVNDIVEEPVALDDNIIPENNNVDYQMPISDNNENMSIEEIKNKIVSLCDLLSAKERKIEEKEQIINAKLEVANKAFENAQAVNQMNNENIVNDSVINIADYQPIDDQEQVRTLGA